MDTVREKLHTHWCLKRVRFALEHNCRGKSVGRGLFAQFMVSHPVYTSSQPHALGYPRSPSSTGDDPLSSSWTLILTSLILSFLLSGISVSPFLFCFFPPTPVSPESSACSVWLEWTVNVDSCRCSCVMGRAHALFWIYQFCACFWRPASYIYSKFKVIFH